ncbi:MAG TPA: membrane dipeptidase [Polyangiaceae bacterium]|nr:membrane dipeptidase [Polyangiaceae bacterium]
MTKSPLIARLALCALVAAVASSARGASAKAPFPVVDLHVDLSYEHNFKGKPFELGSGQFSVRALQQGGVSGVVLPLFVPRDASPDGPRLADLERSYARVSEALAHTPPFSAPGCSAPSGSVRTFFAFEGAGPLATDPDALSLWASRGLRIVGLVHTYANELSSSSGDTPPKPFGLTELGRAFVRHAFSIGLVVDVSHASDRAVSDILSIANETRGVVVATHSNARALADHPRNLTDAELRGIAATGGVIGVNFHGPFLVRGRRATLKDVVAQVQHLSQVAGADHVAIGSDFEGDIRPPAELADASRFPLLSAALTRAGFDDAAIRKIFAENALRMLCPAEPEGASPHVH